MLGTLIVWLVAAFVLHFAVRLTGPVSSDRASFGTAFVATALLSIVGGFVTETGSLVLALAWPVLWLLILKTIYGIGWLRAIGVWLATVAISVALALLVLAPLGLAGALLALLALA